MLKCQITTLKSLASVVTGVWAKSATHTQTIILRVSGGKERRVDNVSIERIPPD